ncbi:hypothetical protein BRAS3843_520163 [Bradyrhizobium sp. STM 3843]|nr:hypothetical protein BRAS3843_520163 [Bradyrhizobium sp. STM 3843]
MGKGGSAPPLPILRFSTPKHDYLRSNAPDGSPLNIRVNWSVAKAMGAALASATNRGAEDRAHDIGSALARNGRLGSVVWQVGPKADPL